MLMSFTAILKNKHVLMLHSIKTRDGPITDTNIQSNVYTFKLNLSRLYISVH